MSMKKLLLVLPMLTFAIGAHAATYDCWRTSISASLFKDRDTSESYLYAEESHKGNGGDYYGFVCGHEGTNGCPAGALVLMPKGHILANQKKNSALAYMCNTSGYNTWQERDMESVIRDCKAGEVKKFKLFSGAKIGKYYYMCENYAYNSCYHGEKCKATESQYQCEKDPNSQGYDFSRSICNCKSGYDWKNNKCEKDINNLEDQQKCGSIGAKWYNGVCTCDGRDYYDPDVKACVSKSQCNKGNVICANNIVTLSDIGNTTNNLNNSSNNSNSNSNANENHNNSHNTYAGHPTENVACTAKTREVMTNCDKYKEFGGDITGALQCVKECKEDGSGWLHYINLCDAAKGYICVQYGDGMGCQKCTKGGKSNGGNGGGASCRNSRTTPEGKACCSLPNSVATYNKTTKGCDCVDPTKEFKMLDASVGACVAKETGAPVTPCDCTAAIKVVTEAQTSCAATSPVVVNAITQINIQCPAGQASANCSSDLLTAYVSSITMMTSDCKVEPAEPAKPTIDNAKIKTTLESLDKRFSKLDTSVWKTSEGNFNGARLASDSIAGVVLGTAGGLITSSIVKKNQIKSGFEDIVCTVGGQEVGSYGDEITVGIK